jgi:glycerol-3-phosphate O-acyltransferase / dihydroxyacetone phosphate acyltransferase
MSWRANPLVRWMARAVCAVFYRVEQVGHGPAVGAVLFLPNHPNSLLDPALVWATSGRDVRFLAKSTLFGTPLRPLLSAAGAIPVYRRLDQGVDTSRNTETFAAVSAALGAGDAVCIFPEGVSHSSGRLEPLRTGAARMTLAAEREGTAVALVPVGLNFDRKATFRSRVTVVFGAPFSARDLLPADDDAFPAAVRTLTSRIAERMRLLLIEAEPNTDAALVDRVDRLYAAARGRHRDAEARVARRRVIAAGIERLRAADRDRYEALLVRLRRYDGRLRRFGLRDRHLDWQISGRDAAVFALRELALAVVLLPLCALGFAVYFVPYHVTAWIAIRVARQRDIFATAQVFTGVVVYGGWLAIIGAVIWRGAGTSAAWASIAALPVLAILALVTIERETAVVDAMRAWWSLRRARHDTRERLRRDRMELAEVLDDVQRWLESEVTG